MAVVLLLLPQWRRLYRLHEGLELPLELPLIMVVTFVSRERGVLLSQYE